VIDCLLGLAVCSASGSVVAHEPEARKALAFLATATAVIAAADALGDDLTPGNRAALAVLGADRAGREIDMRLRKYNPWDPSLSSTGDNYGAEVENELPAIRETFQRAVRGLAAHPNGEKSAEVRCRLRCVFARAHYLAGRFPAAKEELNRAYAFAPKGIEPTDLLTRAIFHLHRAEMSILEGRVVEKEKGARRRLAELHAALVALDQAEELLVGGRRRVFWWCRLFILRARANAELLECLTATQEEEWISRSETLLGAGLRAIAGGLANILGCEQRQLLLEQTWEDLWNQCLRAGARPDEPRGRNPGLIEQRFERWRRLNVQAGLEWFWTEEMFPHRAAQHPIVAHLDGSRSVAVIDIHRRGMAIEVVQAGIGGPVRIDLKWGGTPETQVALEGAIVDAGGNGPPRGERTCIRFVGVNLESRRRLTALCRELPRV
jgi:hypothetical protein